MSAIGAESRGRAAATFEAEALETIAAVRDAFARLIELKCPGPKDVTTLCDSFGVHRKLAWQLTKVAYAENPFIAARHMPSARSVSQWLSATRKSGAPEPLIEAARVAGDRFESLAARHTASRTEFEMLLETFATGADPAADAKWRQQAFHGNSYVWGAHCKALLAISVLAPSEDRAGWFHAAQVRGLVGFRQTRPGVRWIANQSVVADDASHTQSDLVRAPLDPDAARAHNGVPVLPAYCSNPMPALSRRAGPDGVVQDEFLAAPVGQAGERTLVTGELMRNISPAHATDTDKVAHFGAAVRTPSEMLHFDLFVHRALFSDVERELVMFSDLGSQYAFDDADRLPLAERIVELGRGVSHAHTPDIPAYSDLLRSVFAALKADPDEFRLHRVRIPYPPMPTSIMVRHEMPPDPA